MSRLSALLDAVFANRCVLCQNPASSACDPCWQKLQHRPRQAIRSSQDGRALTGMAATDFDQVSAQLIHAYKDSGRSALAQQFAAAMVPLLPMLPLPLTERATLVAVPSRVSSIQQRGYSPATLIASSLARQARRQAGLDLAVDNNLVWRVKESADQATLGVKARHTNLQHTMKASARAKHRPVILVDDIVTTGSSLFETARALEVEGAKVLGFVTFSETILRNFAKTPT